MRTATDIVIVVIDDASRIDELACTFIRTFDLDVDLLLVASSAAVGHSSGWTPHVFDRVHLLMPPAGLSWSDDDIRRQVRRELMAGWSGHGRVHWAGRHRLPRRLDTGPTAERIVDLVVPLPVPGDARVTRPSRAFIRSAIVSSGFALASVAVALLHPWPLKIAIDGVSGGSWHGLHGAASIAVAMAAASVVLVSLGAAFDYGATVVSGRAAERASAELRATVLRRLLHMPMPFFDRYSSGEILSRLGGDVERVQEGISRVLTTTVPELATLVGMSVVLFLIDPVVAAVGLVAAPLLAASTLARRNPTNVLQREARARQGDLQSASTDIVRNARAVQGLAAEAWADERYRGRADASVSATLRQLQLQARFSPINDLILATVSGAVLWTGVARVSSGHLSVGSLLVVFSYLSGVYGPVRELARVGQTLARTRASRERLGEILSHPLPAEQLLAAGGRPDGAGVELRHVSFGYERGPLVLDDVSLTVGVGEHVCVIGPSGAGKTTLLHLLMRLYEPSSGSVRINGVDARQRSLAWWRDQVALVPQESWILDATMRENLVLDGDADDEQIVEALRTALLTDLVARLPDGLDTRLGEGGSRLSGGERRRVALARAMLRRSEVLVLDEPTSGLDPEAERLIVTAIAAISTGRAVLTVTHSPAVAAVADRVLRLDHGHLVPVSTPVDADDDEEVLDAAS